MAGFNLSPRGPASMAAAVNRPTCLLLLRCCAAVLLALPCAGRAQEARDTAQPLSARDPLPALPVNGLLDEGNIFSTEEEALLTADLEDFRHRAGVALYVITANYIFGDTVDHYGERLVNEGLKGRAGVVMLYERGTGKLNFSATPDALGRTEEMRSLFVAGSRAAAFMPDDATTAQQLRASVQALTLAAEQWRKTGKLPDTEAPPAPAPGPDKPEIIPPPPGDFLTDEADAFDEAAETALKLEMAEFHRAQGLSIYVLTSTWLPRHTAQSRAEVLAGAWLGDRAGAVLVMNRGTSENESPLGLAGSLKNSEIFLPADLFRTLESARAKAVSLAGSPGGTWSQGVATAARELMREWPAQRAKAAPASAAVTAPGQWNVMTGVAAALLAGAALLFVFHRVQERLETRSNEQFRFPDVTVGRRLGANQGGGVVAGVSFGERR